MDNLNLNGDTAACIYYRSLENPTMRLCYFSMIYDFTICEQLNKKRVRTSLNLENASVYNQNHMMIKS